MGVNQEVLRHYGRADIQKAIVDVAKNREIAVKYADGGFGKRPDVLQYDSDVSALARDGATSFHLSEEHWSNPLQLKTGMTRRELDELRSGWDLILDVDCKFVEFSKIAAELLVEALQFHRLTNIGLKFSGNRGFHIGVPASSFPSAVDGKKIALLFPEGPRMIADYLSSMIKDYLSERILSISTVKEICQAIGAEKEKIMVKNEFNPLAVVNVDTILISSRHLFRSPYSFNEKSWLVSVVVKPDHLKQFRLSHAKSEYVETPLPFITQNDSQEAHTLLVQAFDHAKKHMIPTPLQEKEPSQEKQYQRIATKIPEEFFPPCMKLILKGLPEDGRKRALFALSAFLKQMNYGPEEIDAMIKAWNEKNYEPLRQNYIMGQTNWHKRNPQSLLPPNCNHEAYYPALGVCKPDNFCSKIKNPVNYSLLRMKLENNKKKPKRKKSE